MAQSDFKHAKRAAIAFKPLDLHDPRTGKAVKPDDLITLPDGKKVKAGPYFAELNKLEQKFNAIGYSLRDKSTKPIVLHDAIVPHDTLRTQIAAHSKAHVAFNAQTMRAVPRIADLEQRHTLALTGDAARVKAITGLAPKASKTVDFVKS